MNTRLTIRKDRPNAISEADRIAGKTYGRLTVIGSVRIKAGRIDAICKCECGAEKTVRPLLLKKGETQSCGCLHRERASKARTSHGHTRNGAPSPMYRVWTNMWTRCTNPKATMYRHYGARGITVCDRWKSFSDFLADIGDRPSPRHSIDRIDPNGHYEPQNVRWATQTEQCRNRRSNRPVRRSDGAVFQSIAEAAQSVGGNNCIWDVCNLKSLRHCGYGWSYA